MTPFDVGSLRERRASDPAAVAAALPGRRRRPLLPADGRLFIVAADHTARNALGVGTDDLAMADRGELLARLTTALRHPGVDGVLGTPDILDDLALLGALDGKVVVGSMNRGGLRGASFELDDRMTAYRPEDLASSSLDMAKLLLRIDLGDAGTVATLESAGAAVTSAARAGMPVMVEPFLSHRTGRGVANLLDADSVIRSVAIAAGLGATSAYTWLKLPVVSEMERVMAATTLPTLLLGGDPDVASEEVYASWEAALALPGVRGIVAGRTLLFPGDGDVEAAIGTTARLVHRGPA